MIAVPVLFYTYSGNIVAGYRLSDKATGKKISMAYVLAVLLASLLVAPIFISLVLFLVMSTLGRAGILISLVLLVLVLWKKGPYYRMYLALLRPEAG